MKNNKIENDNSYTDQVEGRNAVIELLENGKDVMEQIEIENANNDILKKIKIVKDGALLKRSDLDE